MNPLTTQNKIAELVALSSYDLPERGYAWRKTEAALALLGRFAEDVIVFQSKAQSAFKINVFVESLAEQIRSPDYLDVLRGQSLLCVTRYAEIISIKHRELFAPLFAAAALCVRPENELPIRVIGLKALVVFGRKIEKHKLELPAELFARDLAHDVVSVELLPETVGLVLEALAELCSLSRAQTRHVADLSDFLLQVFNEFGEAETPKRLVFALLAQVLADRAHFERVYAVFGRFVDSCVAAYTKVLRSAAQRPLLKPFDLELMAAVLRLAKLLIASGRELAFETVRLLPDMLALNEDTTLHVEATVCLKEFVKVASPTVVEK